MTPTSDVPQDVREIIGRAMHDARRGVAAEEVTDAAIAALREAGFRMIPDGWKLVPVETTWEMEQAWDDADEDTGDPKVIWAAMLSAAPEPPA